MNEGFWFFSRQMKITPIIEAVLQKQNLPVCTLAYRVDDNGKHISSACDPAHCLCNYKGLSQIFPYTSMQFWTMSRTKNWLVSWPTVAQEHLSKPEQLPLVTSFCSSVGSQKPRLRKPQWFISACMISCCHQFYGGCWRPADSFYLSWEARAGLNNHNIRGHKSDLKSLQPAQKITCIYGGCPVLSPVAHSVGTSG